MKLKIATVAAAAMLVAAWTASAAISYTVEGWGPQHFPGTAADTPAPPPPGTSTWGDGYLGDRVELQTYTGSFDLTPGTSIQKINMLFWTGYYTYAGGGDPSAPDNDWQELTFHFGTARNITVDGQIAALSQGGLLFCGYLYDELSFFDGSTTSFIVQGYRVDITPLALPGAQEGWSGQTPTGGFVLPEREMWAQFDVSAVPEPTTMIAGALLLLPFGASTIRILRKRHAA